MNFASKLVKLGKQIADYYMPTYTQECSKNLFLKKHHIKLFNALTMGTLDTFTIMTDNTVLDFEIIYAFTPGLFYATFMFAASGRFRGTRRYHSS